ncbi:superfamily I DNA/RNA helicase [Arthrobacter sp. UYCu511]|uniref:UvrD-helicase domain-containing protein n=1 Tax=Arthrobacter sp. UYCu511 TaxID=3156337 RepID=UPI00339695B1
MAAVTMTKSKDKLDSSMKMKVFDFLQKLQENDASPGLHIEPMQKPADKRVRTGRVDLNFRAVLFRLDVGSEPHYIYIGTWPHDKAISIARTTVLNVNPISGVAELIQATAPDLDDVQNAHDVAPPTPSAVPAASEPDWINGLVSAGYTADYLANDPGIDTRVAQAALDAGTLGEFAAVVDQAPDWQGIALLDLEAGKSLVEVKEELGLGTYLDDASKSEDEKVLAALEHPASKIQFAYIGENPRELQDAIESNDFEAWRTFLHPEQRAYAEKSRNGSFRLSGGAGTGKTVVAVHRAKNLAAAAPSARILLTTFTTTLAKSLESSVTRLDATLPIAKHLGESGIHIAGIDATALSVLNGASAAEREGALQRVFGFLELVGTKRSTNDDWKSAAESVDHGLDASLSNPTFLSEEYVAVVLANSVTTRDQYLKVSRLGRGTALTRPKRIAVWKIFESYRRSNRMDDKLSFAEIAALAAAVLDIRAFGGGARPADHVIVDEAQDFHAAHWLLLRALVAEGPNDLFIAEDSHQRIYGQKVPLSRFGIKIVGRSKRLTLNYRTTAENLAFAVGLLSGASFTDLEDTSEESGKYRSARSGPVPVRQGVSSFATELDAAAEAIQLWGTDSAIGVLVRAKYQVNQVIAGLEERGVHARSSVAVSSGAPAVLTMHAAKGLEFSKVILMGVSDASLPQKAALQNLAESELDEALLRERSLLYVAATRARDELLVTWSGEPSVLLGVSN